MWTNHGFLHSVTGLPHSESPPQLHLTLVAPEKHRQINLFSAIPGAAFRLWMLGRRIVVRRTAPNTGKAAQEAGLGWRRGGLPLIHERGRRGAAEMLALA